MTTKKTRPLRVINSVAPIRICDNGGWTDTWFAGYGRIFNIAVYPYAEVQIEVHPFRDQKDRIFIHAENFGERYTVGPDQKTRDRHPLLEAAIEFMKIPRDMAFEVTIFSEAPSGGSTGTSAAVTVALIGALDRLTPGHLSPHEVALAAQRIETEILKQQCGIQDQLCSAYGGINYIEMFNYPTPRSPPSSCPTRSGGSSSGVSCSSTSVNPTAPRRSTKWSSASLSRPVPNRRSSRPCAKRRHVLGTPFTPVISGPWVDP
jgi:hypothetical protein